MGLDMYLEGHEYIWTDWKDPKKNPKVDGHRLKGRILELGYWRKHPNLHGYIVGQFAGGKDECQEIALDQPAILRIIDAIKTKELPHTEGFFFGSSRTEDDEPTLATLTKALRWLNAEKKGIAKTVVYRASW